MKTVNEELFDKLMRLPAQMRNWLFRERGGHAHDRRHERFERPDFHGSHEGHGRHGVSEHSSMRVRERVLGVLSGCETGLRQKNIAEKINVKPSSMSELIDKLENDGYVERTIDPADKRATLIILTEKGRARACELEDSREERLNAMFFPLTEDEKRELIRLLDRLMTGCNEIDRDFIRRD